MNDQEKALWRNAQSKMMEQSPQWEELFAADNDYQNPPSEFRIDIIPNDGLVTGKYGNRELSIVDKFSEDVTSQSIETMRHAIWFDMEAERIKNRKCPQ